MAEPTYSCAYLVGVLLGALRAREPDAAERLAERFRRRADTHEQLTDGQRLAQRRLAAALREEDNAVLRMMEGVA